MPDNIAYPPSDLSYWGKDSQDLARQGARNHRRWVQVDSFDSRYYGGLDVAIYFDHIWLDEAISLNFRVMENTMPFYGYASYTWDHLARGTRIVQGEFTINFKEAGYIYKLLNQLREREKAIAEGRRPEKLPTIQEALKNDVTLEQLVSMIGKDGKRGIDPNKAKEVYSDFRRALWGEREDKGTLPSGLTTIENRPLFDAGDKGFTLLMKYGEPEMVARKINQDKTETLGQRTVRTGTIKRIVECHINGQSQQFDDSGKPILESYSFVARSIDEAPDTPY